MVLLIQGGSGGQKWEDLARRVILSEGPERDLVSSSIRRRDCWICPTEDWSLERIPHT